MSVEGQLGTDRVFAADLQALRPHPGQAASAANLRRAARRLRRSSPAHRGPDCNRVQDAYSLRCSPAGARRRPRHRRARRAPSPAASWPRPSTTRSCSPTAGSSPTATSTAPRSPTCSTSWRSSPPTSPRSASGAPTGSSTRPAATGCRRSSPTTPASTAGHMIAQYTQAAIVSELKRLAVPGLASTRSRRQRDAGGPRLDGLVGRPQAAPLRRRADPGGRDRGAHRRPRARPARAARARRRPPAPSSTLLRAHGVEGPGPDRHLVARDRDALVELVAAAPSCAPSKK